MKTSTMKTILNKLARVTYVLFLLFALLYAIGFLINVFIKLVRK